MVVTTPVVVAAPTPVVVKTPVIATAADEARSTAIVQPVTITAQKNLQQEEPKAIAKVLSGLS